MCVCKRDATEYDRNAHSKGTKLVKIIRSTHPTVHQNATKQLLDLWGILY